MTTAGIVFVGAFALVFVGFPAAVLLADRYSDRAHAWIQDRVRRIKHNLAAGWMAEEGLTVVPIHPVVPELTPVHVVSADELLQMIREM